MLLRLHELVREQSQFLIATHSPILMAYPNARILRIGESGLERVELEQTEHYVVARRFLNDPRGQVAALLDENEGSGKQS
jgi:predicted ATPase